MLHFAIPAAGQDCGSSGASDLQPGTYAVVVNLTEANTLSQGAPWTSAGLTLSDAGGELVAAGGSNQWTWQDGSCSPPSFGAHGRATTYANVTELSASPKADQVRLDGGIGQSDLWTFPLSSLLPH